MSEPKVVVLGGNTGSWHAQDRISEASTMNGIEAWVYALNGNYIEGSTARSRDLEQYDIVIANYNFSATDHLLKLALNRKAGCKLVILIEGDALAYLKPHPYMRDLMNSSDLIVCINKFTESFFKKLTSTKVEYIGIPYPAEGIRALATPIEKRRKDIFLGPMLLSRWLEYFCVKDMGFPLYGYERRLSRKRKTIIKNIRKYRTIDPLYFHERSRELYKDPSLTILREATLPDFFRHNGGAYLWLNLDQRYTWGRYVLDAAALQVPIITTHSTGHGEEFFPLTTLATEFEIDKAAELVKRLFSDEEFYREVSTIPIEKFDHLRPEVKKKELLHVLYPS